MLGFLTWKFRKHAEFRKRTLAVLWIILVYRFCTKHSSWGIRNLHKYTGKFPAQFYTCWRVQGHGYADAIIGAHANRELWQAFQDCLQRSQGEGKRRNQISWRGSTASKILLMHEVFIEFRQAIIQGIVKCHWMNRLKLWMMGRENSFPAHHLKPSLLLRGSAWETANLWEAQD